MTDTHDLVRPCPCGCRHSQRQADALEAVEARIVELEENHREALAAWEAAWARAGAATDLIIAARQALANGPIQAGDDIDDRFVAFLYPGIDGEVS